MDEGSPSEPMFRPNKRRKVFRRRANSEDSEATPDVVSDSAAAVVNRDDAAEEDTSSSGVVRFQKKASAKKAGIAFTSSDAVRNGDEESEERALVATEDDQAPAVIQGDRFVKPTGRVAVTENKHMTAYIDSKLAEMRSATGTPHNGSDAKGSIPELQNNSIQKGDQSLSSSTRVAAAPTTHDQANARSTRVYQRPTKRKQPPKRGENDVARDSIIDQIMQESQVPLYDRSESHTPGADDVDNDAATAQAFKAQLLAEMEEQNRRRPAPRNPATKPGEASMQSGPKLGGSRAQREKMRALEEAKAKSGSAKK